MDEKKQKKEKKEKSVMALKEALRDKKRWLCCGIESALVVLSVVVDLLTKKYLYGMCEEQGVVVLIPEVLSFVPVQNTGASFGMFSDNTALLTLISTVSALFLFFFIFYSYKYRNLWLRSALVLVTGGAFGNVIDRIFLGYVRDFISFDWLKWPYISLNGGFSVTWGTFAVFNFADCCLTVGCVLLLVYILFFYAKEQAALEKKNVSAEDLNG